MVQQQADTRDVVSTTVTGGGGTPIHVVERGNRGGRPIVFIHGFSQSWLAWERQLCSELAEEFRLVALDLRGHGESGKPDDAYGDSRLWADDLAAVIESLGLEQPLVCGWSYGPLVILDYIRHYGEDRLGGINFVGAISKLGSEAAMSVISPEVRSLVPGLFAVDVETSVNSLGSFLKLFFKRPPSSEDLYLMLGYNLSVPPRVRQALFSRAFDNDDVLARIRKPVLLTHGASDAVVDPIVVDQHRALIPHAEVCVMPEAGHAAFVDQADAFNRRLGAFCRLL